MRGTHLLLLLPTVSALQLRLPAVQPRCTLLRMQYGQQQGYGQPQQQAYGQQQGFGAQPGYGQPVLARIRPTNGIYADSEYVVRQGDQQYLGRRNTWSDKLTISREQCIVQVGQDGSVQLVAVGRPQTGLRNAGGMWQGLGGQYQQEARQLQNGDQICLDSNAPEMAVYTVEIMADDGSVQAQQGDYYGASGYASPQGLPYGWTTAVDPASGQTYYCNQNTGQCQWEMPTQ